MTNTYTKTTEGVSRLIFWLKQQFPGQLFSLFTAMQIIGVGGALYLLRAFNDPYATVPLDAITLGILIPLWGAALVLGVAFCYSLATHKERRQSPKLLAIGALLEVIVFGVLTYRTFTIMPRSHAEEDLVKTVNYVMQTEKLLPVKLNDDITLSHIDYLANSVHYYYDINQKYKWEEQDMRTGLLQKTCAHFLDEPEFNSVQAISYNLVTEKSHRTVFQFTRKDCKPAVITAPAPSNPDAPHKEHSAAP
jgi:hypothetical protein